MSSNDAVSNAVSPKRRLNTVTKPLAEHLVKEWHPSKNGDMKAHELNAGSNRKVWWLGSECGHEWEAVVANRSLGRGFSYCSGKYVLPGFNDLLTLKPLVASQFHPEWKSTVNDRSRGQGCPTCAAHRFISKPEQEIADFIKEQGLIVKQTDRVTIKGMEMDIYIPEKNFAIEYNGLYWHCDLKVSDTKYHYKKWKAAKQAGIQLVQIWEDEWNNNPEQIKAMLLHKLGLSKQEKIFARNTSVVILPKDKAENFLEKNHIQGHASASIYLGLEEHKTRDLIAVLSLKKEVGDTLNIIRYATSKNTIGGFTKLLKYAEINFSPTRFVTFSDHCVSDGNLYKSNGFTIEKELNPDYRYVVKFQRKHKFGYRLKRFKDDPNLQWKEGLTEKELASLNGIPRIWDAGKTKWIKEVAK